MSKYIPIMGLEIHVEPTTKSKMFCGCDAAHFQVKPNTHTCPVCLGLPGALPVPNKKAIQACQLLGLALNCQLAKESKFDRKNYFYPDLAKAYQISQYDQPLCFDGYITLKTGKKIGITRAHMEEDTAKNSHQVIGGKKTTLVDFNRSGVPLIEIVTEPDFRSAEDVDDYLKQIRRMLRFLEISDCDMEKGSMRLEVNLSLATKENFNSDGTIKKFPDYKVELKNINSFRYIQKAIQYELTRQTDLLNQGIIPDQETRGYQESVNKTISQRSKEDAQDYRYFPEPDIPPMTFTDQDFAQIKDMMLELPEVKIARYVDELKLPEDVAEFLTETPKINKYFEQVITEAKKLKQDIVKISKMIKNKKVDWRKLTPQELVEQITKLNTDKITDIDQLTKIANQIIKDSSGQVKAYQSGKVQLFGFFMGQMMKISKDKADPVAAQKILKQLLS